MTSQPATTANAEQPLEQRIVRVLDAIRPAVQQDGGDLEFVSVDANGVVSIRLHGACIGCPSASLTLKLAVERNLKEHVPEVSAVREVD
ncbi:MAG: NifU family protein [Phycisphaerales bacterium]